MSKTYYDYAEVDWEQKYLDLDTGVRMAYYECGPKDGKTVLLDPWRDRWLRGMGADRTCSGKKLAATYRGISWQWYDR